MQEAGACREICSPIRRIWRSSRNRLVVTNARTAWPRNCPAVVPRQVQLLPSKVRPLARRKAPCGLGDYRVFLRSGIRVPSIAPAQS